MAEQAIERVDPEPRSVSRVFLGQVTNPDQGRAYMLANPNEDMFGYAACEAEGWKPLMKGCREKVNGARIAADGSERLQVQGQIVMWRPKAEQDAYLASKHGYAAQQSADMKRYKENIVIDGVKK